jgi:exopolyphosphatase
VVLGNEAGDADSIVSALALAYVESMSNSPKTPIVSIPRDDLCLRREAVLLLELAHVDTSKLYYIDDETLFESPKLVTLVDHNRLTLGEDDWTVTEIIDHHFDEETHTHVIGDLRNIAFENDNKALVASTCTLVAERLFSKLEPPYASSDLSIALLGVILLDTVNMKPAAGKGTQRDQDAIDTLVSKTDWSSLEGNDLIHQNGVIDTDKLYDKLSKSKFDSDFWEQLSVRDALRLDYKRFEAPTGHVFGSSSVLVDMDALLTKPNFVKETISYIKESEIPLLAVLGLKLIGHSTQRELLLCGSDERLVNDMADYILTNPEAKTAMQSEEKPVEKDTGELVVRQFRQGNQKASRKQVAPVMLNFFSSNS